VVAGTTGEGAGLATVARSARDQPATKVPATTDEGAALACIRSAGVGSTSYCGGLNEN
jgi:hypothetical protein